MLFLVAMLILLLLLVLLPLSSIIVVRKTILFVSRMHRISVTYIFCVTSVDDPNHPLLDGRLCDCVFFVIISCTP